MNASAAGRLCYLHINSPEHVFDQGLKAEAERVATELTRSGFPLRVEVHHALGDEKRQMQQMEEGRLAQPHPDLFIVIPINKEDVYTILSQIVSAREDVTCVFLHQPLTRMHLAAREDHKGRLFSVSADQKEIGRLQARQFAAMLPDGAGDVLYVQGRQNSYATAQRMLGLLDEVPRTAGVKVNGQRVFGDWSSGSVKPALEGWKQLGGKLEWIQAAGAQNDDMAMGLAALLTTEGCSVPVIGVDGLEPGRKAVADGTLAATVVQPLGVGHALRLFRDLHVGAREADLIPADGNVVLPPESYPTLDKLRTRAMESKA